MAAIRPRVPNHGPYAPGSDGDAATLFATRPDPAVPIGTADAWVNPVIAAAMIQGSLISGSLFSEVPGGIRAAEPCTVQARAAFSFDSQGNEVDLGLLELYLAIRLGVVVPTSSQVAMGGFLRLLDVPSIAPFPGVQLVANFQGMLTTGDEITLAFLQSVVAGAVLTLPVYASLQVERVR